jgi:hypothetical protein
MSSNCNNTDNYTKNFSNVWIKINYKENNDILNIQSSFLTIFFKCQQNKVFIILPFSDVFKVPNEARRQNFKKYCFRVGGLQLKWAAKKTLEMGTLTFSG